MLTWRRKPDVLASFGSFWELFNRIKRTGPTGVVGISCFESEFSLEGFVGPGVGPNRQLRVFLPRAEKFVSPIAAI